MDSNLQVRMGDLVISSLFVLSLVLFMEPFAAYLLTLVTSVIIVSRTSKVGIGGRVLSLISAALSLLAMITLLASALAGSRYLFLISLMIGYSSPAPLTPVIIRFLGMSRSKLAALGVILVMLGIITLPLYGVSPLDFIKSVNELWILTSAGLYVLVNYSPSSIAILLGYISIIYVVINRLKLVL